MSSGVTLPLPRTRLIAAVTIAASLAAACSSDDGGAPVRAAADTTSDSTTATSVPALPATATSTPTSSPTPTNASPAGDTAASATTAASAGTPSAPTIAGNVLLIGDSSLAGVRWYDGASERLRGATFTLDAESCRRVAVPSCGGREDRIPLNVVQRIMQARPQEFDAVVVMSGYNDEGLEFERALSEVLGSARSLGIPRTVFLTLTTPTPGHSSIVTTGQNLALRGFRPGGVTEGGPWFVADWQTYAEPFMDEWYEDDHVHLSPTGSYAVADYISQVAAHVLGAPCPGASEGICPIPTVPRPDAQADFATALPVRCLEIGESRELVCEPTS